MSMKITLAVLILFCWSSASSQSNKSYIYETDEYKINFPTEPVKTNEEVPSAVGPLLITVLSFEPGEAAKDSNYVYMVIDSRYPDSSIHSDKKEMLDKFFRGAIDGAVKSSNGKIISEKTGNVGKFPSREIEVDYGNGEAIIKIQMILKGSRMILVQTIANKTLYPNISSDHFYNSFKLK